MSRYLKNLIIILVMLSALVLSSLVSYAGTFNTSTNTVSGKDATNGQWAIYGNGSLYRMQITLSDGTVIGSISDSDVDAESQFMARKQGYSSFGSLLSGDKEVPSTFVWYDWGRGIGNGNMSAGDDDVKNLARFLFSGNSRYADIMRELGDYPATDPTRLLCSYKIKADIMIYWREASMASYKWEQIHKLRTFLISNGVTSGTNGAQYIYDYTMNTSDNLYESHSPYAPATKYGWDIVGQAKGTKPFKITIKYMYRDATGLHEMSPQPVHAARDTIQGADFITGQSFSYTFLPTLLTNSDGSVYNQFECSYYKINGTGGDYNIRYNAATTVPGATGGLGGASRTQADNMPAGNIVIYGVYRRIDPKIYFCFCGANTTHAAGHITGLTAPTTQDIPWSGNSSLTYGDDASVNISSYGTITVGSTTYNMIDSHLNINGVTDWNRTFNGPDNVKTRNIGNVTRDVYIVMKYNAPLPNIVRVFVPEGQTVGGTYLRPVEGWTGGNTVTLEKNFSTADNKAYQLVASHLSVNGVKSLTAAHTPYPPANLGALAITKTIATPSNSTTYYVVQEYREIPVPITQVNTLDLNKNSVNATGEVQGDPRGAINSPWYGTAFNHEIRNSTTGAIPTTRQTYAQLIAATRYLFELDYAQYRSEATYDVTVRKTYPYVWWNGTAYPNTSNAHYTAPACGSNSAGGPGDGILDSGYKHQEIGCTHATRTFSGSCNTTAFDSTGRVYTTGSRYCAKDSSPDCGKYVHSHSGCGPSCSRAVHSHSSGCYNSSGVRTCGKTAHSHSGCGPSCSLYEHSHTDPCYNYDMCSGHSDKLCTNSTQYCNSSCPGHSRTYNSTNTPQCECSTACWSTSSYTLSRTYNYKRSWEYNKVVAYDDYRLSSGVIYNSTLGASGQASFSGISYGLSASYVPRTEGDIARTDSGRGSSNEGHLSTPPKVVTMPTQTNPPGVSSNGSSMPQRVSGYVQSPTSVYSSTAALNEAYKQASYDLFNGNNARPNEAVTPGTQGAVDSTNAIWMYGENNTYLWVRNEELIEDGGTIMSQGWVSGNRETIRIVAPAPTIPSDDTTMRRTLISDAQAFASGFTVPATLQNGRYNSGGTLTYVKNSPIGKPGASSPATKTGGVSVNSTIVHTPVAVRASFANAAGGSNDQSVNDITTNVVELDKDFTITFNTSGNHRNTLGYRLNKDGTTNTNRDYNEFIGYADVRFPFDVYVQQGSDYVFVKQGDWYDVPTGVRTITCRVPVWVDEMAYTGTNGVLVRVKAINDPNPNDDSALGIRYANYDTTNQDRLYNSNLNDYRAYDYIDIEVAGRVYDFQVDFTDDTLWSNTFAMGLINLKTGQNVIGLKADLLPLGQKGDNYANKYSEYAGKLGYKFKFELKTKGTKANEIVIAPSFYYVSKDKSENVALQPVDVYYEIGAGKMEKLEAARSTFKITTNLTKPGELPYISQALIQDTNDVYDAYARGLLSDVYRPLILSYNYNANVDIGSVGGLRLPEAVRLRYNNLNNYAYNNYYGSASQADIIEDAGSEVAIIAATSQWFGEYRIPSTSKFVPQGQTTTSNGQLNFITKDGYVIVVFNILANYKDNTGTSNPYLSYQLPAGNTQWDKEGFGYNNRPGLPAGQNRQILLPNGKIVNNLANTNNGAPVFIYESILNNGKDTVGSH